MVNTPDLGYVHIIPDSFCAGTEPYWIGLLFTRKNGDFGAISVAAPSCAAPISKVKSHIWDRCSNCPGKLLRWHVAILDRASVRT